MGLCDQCKFILLHEFWLDWQILKIYKNTTSQISSILVQCIMLIIHTWQCYTGIWHDFEILVMLLLSMLARLLSFSHRTTSLPMKCLMRRGLCGGRVKDTKRPNKQTNTQHRKSRDADYFRQTRRITQNTYSYVHVPS